MRHLGAVAEEGAAGNLDVWGALGGPIALVRFQADDLSETRSTTREAAEQGALADPEVATRIPLVATLSFVGVIVGILLACGVYVFVKQGCFQLIRRACIGLCSSWPRRGSEDQEDYDESDDAGDLDREEPDAESESELERMASAPFGPDSSLQPRELSRLSTTSSRSATSQVNSKSGSELTPTGASAAVAPKSTSLSEVFTPVVPSTAAPAPSANVALELRGQDEAFTTSELPTAAPAPSAIAATEPSASDEAFGTIVPRTASPAPGASYETGASNLPPSISL
uniref:Uncharacterized protein n=1 Tax=Zooxanthella nutricula TaxID=1333877 RepID=A0A7S2PGE5_9DINO